MAHGPSCSVTCGIFPDRGSNPCPLHRQADSQPRRHQGSPIITFYKCNILKIQYTLDHVAGPGGDTDPTLITFPGCVCLKTPCLPGTCSCLRREKNYDDNLCLRHIGSEAKCAEPVFECNVLCQCSDHCRNRVVQRGLQFHLQVFKTDRKGWGLRTLDFIPKGRFVCEYAGEVLGFPEVQRRIQLQTIHDSNYIIAVREHVYNGQVMETFVDPTSIGNIGRFLNHSCEPNLLMIPVRINSMVPKLALFAAKDIVPEEELSYDYSGRFLNPLDSEDKESTHHRRPCEHREKTNVYEARKRASPDTEQLVP
ncbi:histone-lysine N-methyltransferase SETMAR isoform X1 [Physeter macrocephalus]|uniref:Histone-lysine N-methyltransferase SETMAR n=1 Tax=Physeter macrocephalus TaxID=9755 RepID=A0A9W2W952_PHYMC|nr:histone-lysine N-methyltransferase SETMAR isoform X1 [Physeter catodon]XP_054935739.1 histone-lysine N-methyltransferase SETMAR isoform X1 [Physeter catodon]